MPIVKITRKNRGSYGLFCAYVAILVFFLAGCSNHNTKEEIQGTGEAPSETLPEIPADPKLDPEPGTEKTFSFMRDVIYGETEEILLGRILSVAVDDFGRVYMADRDHITIHVYQPDGEYLKSLARQGHGPGELDMVHPNTHLNFDAEYLYVSDGYHRSPHRIHVFSLEDLSFSHTLNTRDENKQEFDEALETYEPELIYPLSDGNFLAVYTPIHSPDFFQKEENVIRYYIHDSNGQIISGPVLEQKHQQYLYHVVQGNFLANSFPFLRKPLLAVSDEDHLFAAWTKDFRIEVYQSDGKKIRSIEHPLQNQPLTQCAITDKIELCDALFDDGVCEQMVRNASNLPQTWPALDDMLIDDENRLWVSTIVEDFDIYEWWVLEETGELITRFKWPRDEPIEVVKNGYMYTRETDEETGLQQVVRYRIEMTDEK